MNKIRWKEGTYNTGIVRISVTNRHIHNKGKWVMNVREFGWSCVEIGIPDEATEQEAQNAAIYKARIHCRKMYDSLTY